MASSQNQYVAPPTINTSSLDRTFSDDFNTLSLYDTKTHTGVWKTNYQYGHQSDWTSRTFPATGEKEIYVAPAFAGATHAALGLNPFSLHDGALSITARRTPAALTSALWGYKYTSGVLTTETSFSQTYGYFEVRAQLPADKGMWPAFWMVPTDATAEPELDIMEQLGGSSVFQTLHTKQSGTVTQRMVASTVPTDTTAFHTYGALWTPQTVTFYIDGAKVSSMPTPADMHKPMYLILNLAVGGTWPGDPPANFTSGDYKIDYVRAYSLDGLEAKPLPDAVTTASSYTLGAGQHSLTLTGSADVSGTGNSLNNQLTGNSGDNRLSGGAGADTLISGAGLDTLTGGAGDDRYVVTGSRDKVVEAANQGHDTVFSASSYVLPANIEDLVLQLGGKSTGYGNRLANHLTGNTGANVLDGMGGNDTLTGGLGADTFRLEPHFGAQDVISDFDAHGEKDALDLSAFVRAGYRPTLKAQGDDTLISFKTGDTVLIGDVHPQNLSLFSPGLFH